MGAVRAPLTEETAQEVDQLISEDAPDGEVAALRHEVRLAFASVPAGSGVRHRHLRGRLRVLKRSAALGPSSWWNGHLQAVGQAASGVLALAQWAALWHRAALSEPAAALWSAACVAPADSGEPPAWPGRPAGGGPAPEDPAHCVLRGAGQASGGDLGRCPDRCGHARHGARAEQLGCGAADGSGIIISLVRTWAGSMGGLGERVDEPDGVAALDLENAYRLAFRSSCLRGLRVRAPALAVMAAAQWQNQTVGAWQRALAGWRYSFTHRGGWQGSRLMQVAFCTGLEDSCSGAEMFALADARGLAGSGGVRGPPGRLPHLQVAWALVVVPGPRMLLRLRAHLGLGPAVRRRRRWLTPSWGAAMPCWGRLGRAARRGSPGRMPHLATWALVVAPEKHINRGILGLFPRSLGKDL